MQGSLKEIRYPVTILCVLAVTIGVSVLQRYSIHDAALRAERYFVALWLLKLEAGSVRLIRGATPHAGLNPDIPDIPDGGRIDAFRDCMVSCAYLAQIASGGSVVLYVYLRRQQDEPAEPGYIVTVNSTGEGSGATLSNHKFRVFTQTYEPDNRRTFLVEFIDPPYTHSNRLTEARIAGALMTSVRRFGLTSDTSLSAYKEMRAKFEVQELTLPGLGLTIRYPDFLPASTFMAMAMAIWASFLLRHAHQSSLEANASEPWVLVEPFRLLRGTPRLLKPLAWLEASAFFVFHLIAMVAPLWIWFVMHVASPLEPPALDWATGMVCLLFSITNLSRYLLIVWDCRKAPAVRR